MLLVLLGLFVSVYLIYHFYWKRRNFPPGPLPLPLIGNLHTIARKAPGYEAYCNWREQYGPVYTYWIANMPAVAVTDFKTLHETFIKDGDAYADRMPFEEMNNILRGLFDIDRLRFYEVA
jgi:cytochrome P450 family 33